MSIRKFIAGIGLVFALVLSGCGGPGDEDSGFLTLTIGDKKILTSSSSRELPKEIKAQQDVVLVKVNKSGTLSLSGGDDKNLFELKDTSGGKMLAFRTSPNPYEPKDADKNGVYEVDITGTSGDESITYKAAYKIPVPTSAQKVLLNKTFYLDFGDNNYSKVAFGETNFATTKYYYNETSATMKHENAFDTSVTYKDNYFTYQDGGAEVKCTLKDEYDRRFACKIGSNTIDRVYRTLAPAFVIPSSYTVTVKDGDAGVTNKAFPHPRITSFSLTGNKANDNGKVLIYNSRFDGKFSYNIQYEAYGDAKVVVTGLSDGNKSIIYTLQSGNSSQINEQCIFDEISDNGNVHYHCNGIDQNNTDGIADTTFLAVICDDNNFSNPDRNCSSAEIPVLFVEE